MRIPADLNLIFMRAPVVILVVILVSLVEKIVLYLSHFDTFKTMQEYHLMEWSFPHLRL